MLDQILSRGKYRILQDRILSDLALAGSISLGAVILVLILGTRILDWWVPVLLLGATFGADAIRAILNVPTDEKVARMLDNRCHLADTLATAVHFRSSLNEVAGAQRRQAENAVRQIDLAQALPFQFPKAAYALAGLGIAALCLFIYRFGTERELTLSAPIAHLNLDALSLAAHADEKARQDHGRKSGSSNSITPEGAVNRLGTSTSDNPGEKDSLGPSGTAVTTGSQQAKNDANSPSPDGKKTGGAREEATDSSDAGAGAPRQNGDQPPSSRDGSPQSAQSGSKPSGTPDSSGLMSKLRDAVSSLISRMKPQGSQAPPGGAQAAQQPNGKPPSGQPGASQQGKPDASGNPSDQDGQESAASESDQMAPGKGAGKTGDQSASAKPGSGMGHQDGSKELKDAEQLSAMGKLSEIIGKRSANVTGEMTIEPQNGPQQLRTGYTRSTARHGEASGDVNRDEVPIALQSYVQEYFDQVHKQATARAKRSAN